MIRMEFRAAMVAGAVVALLACGGGGDSRLEAPAARFNADAAFANALAGTSLSGLTATDTAGVMYQAALAYTPLPDGMFLGTLAHRGLQTTSIGRVGDAPSVAEVTVFYDTDPARLLGTVTAAGKTTVFEQAAPLPSAAAVGASGVFAQGRVYASPALTEPIGTETLSWSIKPDATATATAFACLTSVSRTTGPVSTERDCFRIDGEGNITGGTIFIDAPGLTLTFSR